MLAMFAESQNLQNIYMYSYICLGEKSHKPQKNRVIAFVAASH